MNDELFYDESAMRWTVVSPADNGGDIERPATFEGVDEATLDKALAYDCECHVRRKDDSGDDEAVVTKVTPQ